MSNNGVSSGRIFAAELIGTAVLMIGGPGSAVLATGAFGVDIGVLGVSLAFGLALLVMAYSVGQTSGCHINPAVTVAMALARRVEARLVPVYLAAQLAGAALGGLIIWVIATNQEGFSADPTNFAVNGWAELSPGGFGFGAMVVVEAVLTALLVFVVLHTTLKKFTPAAGGLAVGMTLTLIHLVSIPIDNTSVNPARSFGVAIFAGGDAIEQLWAFFVFPLIGAVIGLLAWVSVAEETIDDTALEALDDVLDGD